MEKQNPLLTPPRKRYVDFDEAGQPMVYGRRVSLDTFVAFVNYNLDALEQLNGNLAVILEKDDFLNEPIRQIEKSP